MPTAGSLSGNFTRWLPLATTLLISARVLGGDVVADELGHVREAHDPVVEVDPLVHVAELDVADDVVEGLEDPLRRVVGALHRGASARRSRAGTGPSYAAAVDQRVPGVAVRRDRGDPHRAVLVGHVVRLLEDRRALGAGVLDAGVDVGHLERDVDDAVAVPRWWSMHRAVRVDAALEHEPHGAALEHVGVVVAVAGLGPGVGDEVHAEGGHEEVRGLGRVADGPDDGVPAGDRERVGGVSYSTSPTSCLSCSRSRCGEAFGSRSGRRLM